MMFFFQDNLSSMCVYFFILQYKLSKPIANIFEIELLFKMENRIYKPKTCNLNRSHSSTRIKFKQIHPQSDFNELNSKYELYRQGSPNIYQQDLTSLKANNIKGQISMLQLPAIDYIITQIAYSEKDKHANQRNYELYPSLLKNNHGRYKQMLSQKQQVKDFILWFEGKYQQIDSRNNNSIKKFQDKQTLIAAGFSEMTGQVAKITKNRAELLKMLWNREHQEVKTVIQSLNCLSIKKQKNLLEQISSIHKDYQQQIEQLRKLNTEIGEKYMQQQKFSRGCVEELRRTKKRLKKSQYLGRKLAESNGNCKKQNIHLLEQNIKLMANIKEITLEQSAILNYRKLQLHQFRKHQRNIKYKQLLALTQSYKEDSLTPLHDLQQKKNTLYDYFLQRMRENPDEKQFIRQQYFPDEEANRTSIDKYFQTVINRPNVQTELLTQKPLIRTTHDRGVNTLDNQQDILDGIISLDKGIQVSINQTNQISGRGLSKSELDLEKSERRIYHVFDKKQQEHKQKQSKIRIIQHRISRRNSLTLLQLQNLGIFGKNKEQKKQSNSPLSKRQGISKTHTQGRIQIQNYTLVSKKAILSQDESSLMSEKSNQSQLVMMQDLSSHSALTTIQVRRPSNIVIRKSANFQTMIQQIDNSLQLKKQSQEIQYREVIHLDEQQQERIKISQIDDLITKHLQKGGNNIRCQGVQKNLNKTLMALFKNVWLKSNINIKVELLDVIKQSYGNTKLVLSKFLNIIGVIKQNENYSAFLKIVSLLFNINSEYAEYKQINTSEIANIYFRLYGQLSIKTIQDNSFSLWKACTTIDKVKTTEFIQTLQSYFSEKKRKYIDTKIAQQMSASQLSLNNKKNNHYSSNKRIHIVNEEANIIKLNPLLLYIIEVYLIEKNLYYSSYSSLIQFISEEGAIQGQLFIWLLQILNLTQEDQKVIISFAFPQQAQKCRDSNQKKEEEQQNKSEKKQRHIKNDIWYRCCIKFDFPLMEQLSVSTYSQMKLLPEDIQQNYYRMIGIEGWNEIKSNLLDKYLHICQSSVYFKAFTIIAEKLERQIEKGFSIYGDSGYCDKNKDHQEVFSLLYRILIIQAHRNLIGQDRGSQYNDKSTLLREIQ